MKYKTMACKCDKCGKDTVGEKWAVDGQMLYRRLVLCTECEKKHKMFAADLAKRLGITVSTEGKE
jgi:hypothetical protein